MASLGDRIVGLDGVVAQQANYAKSGFHLAWNNQRYEGRGGGSEPSGLVPLAAVPFAELAAYDKGLFPRRAIASSPAGASGIRDGRSSRRGSHAASGGAPAARPARGEGPASPPPPPRPQP